MSEDWYRRLLEESSDVIVLLDTEGVLEYVSPSMERLLGYAPEQLVGEDGFDYIHPEDRHQAMQEFTGLVSGDRDRITTEFRFKTPDGDWMWLELQSRNLLDDPQIDGILVSVRDISQRKEQEQRFQALIENSTDIITVLSLDGSYEYVSPSMERVLGYDPDELIGKVAFQLVHPEDRERIMETFNDALEHPELSPTEEYRIQHKDGSWRWIESVGSIELETPGVNGIVINSRDITERKEAEQELQRKNQRLEEFASVVSHDLKNPLNVAALQLSLAQDECESSHLEEVEQAHGRIEQLIDDLLYLARTGEQVTELEEISLPEITHECWQNISSNGATLNVTADSTIKADRGQFQQLLENLLSNAVRHCGEGVTVTIGESEHGFYVADDGPGIPPDDRDRVFESGFSTHENGTGFGLSIVQQTANAHDWDVVVSESSDGGTRFSFTDVEFAQK